LQYRTIFTYQVSVSRDADGGRTSIKPSSHCVRRRTSTRARGLTALYVNAVHCRC